MKSGRDKKKRPLCQRLFNYQPCDMVQFGVTLVTTGSAPYWNTSLLTVAPPREISIGCRYVLIGLAGVVQYSSWVAVLHLGNRGIVNIMLCFDYHGGYHRVTMGVTLPWLGVKKPANNITLSINSQVQFS